jgi:ribosomal protein S18 acetylase RimI-like enzyme
MDAHEAAYTARLAAATPHKATRADIPALAALLTGAFADDPLFRWGFRAGAQAPRALRTYFDFSLKDQCAGHDEMHVAGEMQAAAVWLPPAGLAGLSLPAWRMALMLPTLLKIAGWSRLGRAAAMGEALEKHHPPEPPHWYLFFLGVAPDLRGKGVGSTLLESTLQRVDGEAMPAYLDNSNPKNTRLYERAGFRIVSEYRARKDAPPVWGMWRDARKPSAAMAEG